MKATEQKKQKQASVHCNPKIKPQLAHNCRSNDRAESIIKERSNLNEFNIDEKEARIEIDKLYDEAKEKFYFYLEQKNGLTKSGKPKGYQNFTKKEKCYTEFIYEIGENTTWEQCVELTQAIEKHTGFKGIQLAIHRDEGNKKNGEIHYHAHAVFFTLDSNGLQLARREASLNPQTLSKLQDEASKILKMPRGREYFKNNEERPLYRDNYKDYKKDKQLQEQMNEIKVENEAIKKEIIPTKEIQKIEKSVKGFLEQENEVGQDLTWQSKFKSFFKRLNPLKNEFTYNFVETLSKAWETMQEKLQEAIKEAEKYRKWYQQELSKKMELQKKLSKKEKELLKEKDKNFDLEQKLLMKQIGEKAAELVRKGVFDKDNTDKNKGVNYER